MAKKPLAERLQGVEGHPVVIIVKWAVGAWLLVWSVLAPVQSCRQQAEADRRAGLLSVPDVRLELHADRCTLLNTGVRPVAEVTLIWTNYAVLRTLAVCGPGQRRRRSRRQPRASCHPAAPSRLLGSPRKTRANARTCSHRSRAKETRCSWSARPATTVKRTLSRTLSASWDSSIQPQVASDPWPRWYRSTEENCAGTTTATVMRTRA